MKTLTLLALALLASTTSLFATDASLYEQARELYKQGPAKAPEIVRLLREHIAGNPDDIEAVSLLRITLFGIEKPAEALPMIERAIALAEQKEEIRPKMLMLRARSLYALDRHWECKRVLEVYWAFWQNSPELKRAYEGYYPKVKDAKEPKEANQPQPPPPASNTSAAGTADQ